MFGLIKQVFIAFLSLSGYLATKCLSLSNKSCIVRSNLIDLNPIELNCHLFMINLDEYNGSCNVADDLSTKIYVFSETKDVKVTKIIEAKTLVKHITCDCKCKFNSTTSYSNQKWNSDKCQY